MPGAIDISAVDKSDAEDVAWTIIEILSDQSLVSASMTMLKCMEFVRSCSKEPMDDIPPNPWFMQNNLVNSRSVKTASYLRARGFTQLGSGLVSIAGVASSVSTAGVDTAAALQAANAMGSTGAHMANLHAMSSKWQQSQKTSDWIKAIQTAKGAKMSKRCMDLAGAVIPGASLPMTIVGAATKLGVKVTLGKLVAKTSMEIHWEAYRETANSASSGSDPSAPRGPASEIMHEIFIRRGFTRIFGQYDVATLIREPCGWVALNDKLMLM